VEKISLICLISHPVINPSKVTNKLGLEPYLFHMAGEKVTAPNGALVGGVYQESKWGYEVKVENDEELLRHFEILINHLLIYKNFMRMISREGGRVIVFFNVGNMKHFAFQIDPKIIQKMSFLKIHFGFEIFCQQQRDSHSGQQRDSHSED